MQKFIKISLLAIILIISGSCKKEIKIATNDLGVVSVFGSGAEHYLNQVIQTSDNNYLLCGTTIGGEHGMFDGFVMKVDENFNVLWYKNYGGIYEDYFIGMTMDDNENIMLCGYSASFGVSVDPKYSYWNPLFYMLYADKNGNKIWEKTFQANPAGTNYDNRSMKVLYLKNNSFAISGITRNYTVNGGLTYDNFAFCIDNKANITWTKRLFVSSQSGWTEDYNSNAILSADDNLLVLIRNDDSASAKLSVIKTATNSSGFTTNNFLWKGPELKNIVSPITGLMDYLTIIPMASCGGDKAAIANKVEGGMVLTNDSGSISKRVSFKYPFIISDIYKKDNTLVIAGSGKTPTGSVPSCALTDLEGNILKEIYLNTEGALNPKIKFWKVYFNKSDEIIAFGTVEATKGSNIIMLKFDNEGKIIKN